MHSYRAAAAFSAGVVGAGFAVEAALGGRGLALPAWPANAAVLVSGLVLLLFLHAVRSRSGMVRLLAGAPMAISSMACFLVLAMISGVLPQGGAESGLAKLFGFTHMVSSWPFAGAQLLVLTCLGLAVISRCAAFSWKELTFLCNHLGLFVVFAAGIFGSGDMQRVVIGLQEGQTLSQAVDAAGRRRPMPFSLTLKDFSIEEFPAELSLYQAAPDRGAPRRAQPQRVAVGARLSFGQWDVLVDDYLEAARPAGEAYVGIAEMEALPAARLSAVNRASGERVSGWVAAHGHGRLGRHLMLGEREVLLLETGRVKRFRSVLSAELAGGSRLDNLVLEVNKPLSLAGWTLYQASYDERLGKWSEFSGIEAVRDPWLPAVYAGMLLMIVGALRLIWQRRLFSARAA